MSNRFKRGNIETASRYESSALHDDSSKVSIGSFTRLDNPAAVQGVTKISIQVSQKKGHISFENILIFKRDMTLVLRHMSIYFCYNL